jgi:serine phosphatase RsbU (regulator of sigma subunit)/anti-sigma regulatory factor (Ser/Thr protein kinase)
MNPHEADRHGRDQHAAGPAQPALILVDGAGAVALWSPGASRLLGYDPGQVLGRPLAELLAPDGGAPVWTDGFRGELGMRHRDGEVLRLTVRVRSLQDHRDPPQWLLAAGPPDPHTPGGAPRLDERALLDWLFTTSDVALSVYDDGLRRVRESAAMARIDDEQAPPRRDADAWRRRMGDVVRTGEPATTFLTRRPGGDAGSRVYSATASALRDPGGRVLGVCSTLVDVTAEHLAADRLRLLNEASTRIGSTLDVTRTAQELADLAVSRLADFVSVDLLEPVLRGEDPGPVTVSAVLRRVAHSSVAPGAPETVVRPGDVDRYVGKSPPVRALATRRPVVLDMTDERVRRWMAQEPERAAKSELFGFKCLMVVPLVARGTTLGVAVFIRWRRTEQFDRDDLAIAEELAARAAVGLDNARRYTWERTAALGLQRSLLPHRLPRLAAVEASSRYLPTGTLHGVGGDWFDVIPLPGARVALVVGDVVGHGMHAAASMGRLRTAVRTLAEVDLAPDELLTRLDNVVGRINAEEEPLVGVPGGELSATCLYAVYSPVSGRCALASAGHPPPGIRGPDGRVTFPDLPVGPPLGMGDVPFESAELRLQDGTLLALYTDGLIASFNREPDRGLDLLREVLGRPGPTLDGLCDTVVHAMLSEHPADDAALLLTRTRILGPDRVAELDLPADPSTVADARSWAVRRLAEWGLSETAFVTELVVSELVTNAIRYAGAPIRLTLIRDETLVCEVSDGTGTAPHLHHARVMDEGGRGLMLVAQLTHRWGSRLAAHGKTIWCEQLLPPE